MAIKIKGDPKDVKRYREILHKRGEFTKSQHKNNPVLLEKPEGFRLLGGSFTTNLPNTSIQIHKNPPTWQQQAVSFINKGTYLPDPNTKDSKDGKQIIGFDIDLDRLDIAGTANAKIC